MDYWNFASMIQIFASGVHKGRTYTDQQIQEIAETYDRKRHEAPFLINHDETMPNQGLVKAVIALGGKLFAIPHKVVTEFAESVNSGRQPKISVRLYHPDDDANPVKGKWGLRHVSSIQVPAVKGMEDPTFSESSEDSLKFCFSEPADTKFVSSKSLEFMDCDDLVNAQLWAKMRDWMISKFSLEVADAVIPAESIDMLKISAAQEDMIYAPSSEMRMNYSEGEPVDFAEKEVALALREAAIATRETQLTKIEFSEYCDKLIGDGKVFPHEKNKIVATLIKLSKSADVIEFSEGDEAKSESLLETYKGSLEARIKQIEFSEIPQGIDPIDLNDGEAIAEKAIEFAEEQASKGIFVNSVEAVNHILGSKK